MVDNPKIIHYAGYAPWIFCKNKSLHSKLWWDTYRSLKAFPQVKVDYVKSIVKYFGRYILSELHLIGKNNKYHINQYYNHPKVTIKSIKKRINGLNNLC